MYQNELSNQSRKKIGIGSISLLLFILGLLFSISFGEYGAFGDHILKGIGLSPWSNGDTGLHYTIFYSLIFYVAAFTVGYKCENSWGAKTGRILSLIMILLMLFLSSFIII